jgi:hypothetical protein
VQVILNIHYHQSLEINEMKILILTLGIMLIISCSSKNSKKPNDNPDNSLINSPNIKSTQISDFNNFIENFKKKDLPIVIDNIFSYWNREVYDTLSGIHIRPAFKRILENNYKFIDTDSINSKFFEFKSGYKIFDATNFVGIIFLKDSVDKEGLSDQHWIVLKTFNRMGNPINKLTVAGYRHGRTYQFCNITKDFLITTENYFLYPSEPNIDSTKIHKITYKYLVNTDGNFKEVSFNDTTAYFMLDKLGKFKFVHEK